jgi:hypothetical protein
MLWYLTKVDRLARSLQKAAQIFSVVDIQRSAFEYKVRCVQSFFIGNKYKGNKP